MGRVGAGDCGGGAPRPHGPMTSAGPTPDLPRPLSASRCLGRLWAATRREGSRARSLTPAGRAAKLLQLLIAMGGSPRASGRRARAIWALLCARALSGGAGALGSSVAAPNDARSTRRAAGCPPAPLGCVPAARGGSARPHSSSCSAGRHVTSGPGWHALGRAWRGLSREWQLLATSSPSPSSPPPPLAPGRAAKRTKQRWPEPQRRQPEEPARAHLRDSRHPRAPPARTQAPSAASLPVAVAAAAPCCVA